MERGGGRQRCARAARAGRGALTVCALVVSVRSSVGLWICTRDKLSSDSIYVCPPRELPPLKEERSAAATTMRALQKMKYEI